MFLATAITEELHLPRNLLSRAKPKTNQQERCRRRLFSAQLHRRQKVAARNQSFPDSSLAFLSGYLEEQRSKELVALKPVSKGRAKRLIATAAADASSLGGGGSVGSMARVRQRLSRVPRNVRELYSY